MKTVRIIHWIGLLLPALSLAQSAFADVTGDLKQAQRLCKAGRYVEAEQACQKILDAQPGDSETIYQVGKMLPQVYLATDRLPQAQEAVWELLVKSASHEYLPHALHEIIEQAKGLSKAAHAGQMCRNLLDAGPKSSQAIWLKMGAAVADVYLGKDPAVDNTVEDLIANNAADPRAAEAIAQIGWAYDKLEEYDKAKPLYEHVVDNWSGKPRAMYAHAALVQDCIRLKGKKAAQGRLEQLSKRYAGDAHLPNILEEIARGYREAKMLDEGKSLAQYVLDNYPGKDPCIWAERDVILCDVGLHNRQTAQAGVGRLVQEYSGNGHLPYVLNEVARIFREARMYDQARPLSRYVLDNYPEDDQRIWAQRDLILCDIAQGNQDDAQAGLQRLVRDRSTDGYLPYVLCEIAGEYRKDRLYGQAKSVAKYILDKYPECNECLWAQRDMVLSDLGLKDAEAANAGIKTLLTEYVAQSGVWWAVQDVADAYGAMGRHEQARDLYRWNLTNHSTVDDTIWSLRGLVKESIALKDEAVINAGIKKLVSEYTAAKDLPMAVVHIGRELCGASHPRASELFQYVIDKHPDHEQAVLARAGIGMVQVCQGNDEGGEAIFQDLLADYKTHPMIGEAMVLAAEGYLLRSSQEYKQRQFELAEDHLRKAVAKADTVITGLEQMPQTSARAFHITGLCYRRLGEYRIASEYLRAAVEQYPDYDRLGDACYTLGLCCNQAEQYLEAAKYLERALSVWPDHRSACEARNARLLAYNGLYRTEAISLEEAIAATSVEYMLGPMQPNTARAKRVSIGVDSSVSPNEKPQEGVQ